MDFYTSYVVKNVMQIQLRQKIFAKSFTTGFTPDSRSSSGENEGSVLRSGLSLTPGSP